MPGVLGAAMLNVNTVSALGETNEVSGTLYAYTYTKDIDFKKLEADIREVLKGNYQPDTKSINKKKD